MVDLLSGELRTHAWHKAIWRGFSMNVDQSIAPQKRHLLLHLCTQLHIKIYLANYE